MSKSFRNDKSRITRKCAACPTNISIGDDIIIMSDLLKNGFDMLCLPCGKKLRTLAEKPEETSPLNSSKIENLLIEIRDILQQIKDQ